METGVPKRGRGGGSDIWKKFPKIRFFLDGALNDEEDFFAENEERRGSVSRCPERAPLTLQATICHHYADDDDDDDDDDDGDDDDDDEVEDDDDDNADSALGFDEFQKC